ncbi:hypothetical protein [Verrucomicrobium sp. BvORR034]|uniref:hypothetical protein n=1 Tax=Verrucomicrobium sp. BvORR034 TaxID=1396418 RepID=UPI000679D1AB|nr:hypothetical protein [Verrucomicrobium sp. BvORR034]
MQPRPEDSHVESGPDLSHERESSAATFWVCSILAALVLYILSPGVLVYYQRSGSPPPPEWVRKALYPLEWCYENFGPVKVAYDAYFKALSGHP